jgi:anti-sigma factor RsiW
MDCALTRPELLPYCFGEIDDGARLALERHLASCPHCLAEFFACKRALETSGPTPSPAAKARLRAAVVQAVARTERRAWSWWERPLAVACATAAVVVATAATVSLAASPGAAPHGWVARQQ